MDSLEATEKLRTVQKVLAAFRSSFLETQARSGGVWKIHPSAPFARLDAFLERCKVVQDLKVSSLQFLRLERVEIGGTEVWTSTPPLPPHALSCFCLVNVIPGATQGGEAGEG